MLNSILCYLWGHVPFNLGMRVTHWGALISRPEDPYLCCQHCFKDLEGAKVEYELKHKLWVRSLYDK